MSNHRPHLYTIPTQCKCCGAVVPKVNMHETYVCHRCKEKRKEQWVNRDKDPMRACKACGESKKTSEWHRDAGGRLSKHCGCRDRSKVKISKETKLAKKALWKRNARIRGRPGFNAVKHDAHVDAWTEHIKRTSKKPLLHDAHVKEWRKDDARMYRWQYRHDEEFRIKERLRRQLRKKAKIESIEAAVRASIHGKKSGAAIEQLLGYSMTELKVHLERQFRGGMNWRTYGRKGWHIDHIKPKRCFDLTRIDEIRAFWSLPNLRPLSANENLKKNQKVYHLL